MNIVVVLIAAFIVTIATAQTPCTETDCNSHASSVSGDLITGCTCTCATGYAGSTCDACAAGFHGYPNCVSCDIVIDRSVVTTLAGGATGSDNHFADGQGANAEFSSPSGVVEMPDGSIAVSDTNNHRIRLVTRDGTVTTFAGSGVPGFADGPGPTAQFNGPYGVAVVPSGSIVVGDSQNNRIRRVVPDGFTITLAGTGTPGFADGPGATAMLNEPKGVAVLPSGSVVVADSRNNRLRVVSPEYMVTTLAGSGAQGSDDGPGATATFTTPTGVAVTQDGSVVVASKWSHSLRLVSPDGTVSTIATHGASFNTPQGVGVLQ